VLDLAAPDRADFAAVNRVRLRVWEWGDEADPVVICTHGAYDHGRMWDGLAPRIAKLGFRVVAPDLRGHGDSSRLTSGHVWLASASDIASLARHYGPPVGLIGHSFGGGQALMVAGVWPELVRWVVNLDGLGPPASMFEEERDLAAVAAAGFDAAERVFFSPPRTYGSRADMADRRGRVNVRLPRPWLEHLIEHGSAETDDGFAWKSDPLFSIGLPGDFNEDQLNAEHAQVRCPVLVLTGSEHDTWSEASDDDIAKRMAHLANGRHHLVEGAGHYVHIEQPDAVLERMIAFWQEVGDAR
jgi:pimeloyl-ACP methyl ester carboxylesterase